MFCVSETEAAAIRVAFFERGELAAVAELRRIFPGMANNQHLLTFARTIAGWQPPAAAA